MFVAGMSVKRPVTTVMLMLIAVLLGLVSLNRLPVDLYPEIEVPVAIVSVDYSGVAPAEMETLVTKPLEQVLSTVSDLDEISSYSRQGSSIIIVQFQYGTNMDFAALEMREKVDMVKGALPDGAGTPMVLKIDPNAMPVIALSMSSQMPIDKLQSIVEDDISSRIERLDGVASVSSSGGKEKEIRVELNQAKLSGYGISITQIQNVLRSENLNLPGGTVKRGDQELIVRTTGEFKTVDEIRNIPLTLRSGENIRLYDVASVEEKYKDINSMSRYNGESSISLSVSKQSVANTVKVAEAVLLEVNKLKAEYPDINMEVAMDQSEFINKSISNVVSSAVGGGLLAIIILFLFLRNIRSTFIVGIAIPVSIVTTFALMYFADLSINLISLGGLALGVGMLVDNSIVVLENIYRLAEEEGYQMERAAIEGTKQVGMAVFASTLTTVAVFLPIVFVEGFTAIIFKQLSYTVTFSLLSSLVVALTVVPMLSAKILKVGETKKRKHKGFSLGRILDVFSNGIDWVAKKYSGLLRTALSHRKLSIILAVALLISSVGLVSMVGSELFPAEDEGSFTVDIEMPFGASLEDTDALVQKVEAIVDEIPEKDDVFSNIGSTGNQFSLSATNSSQVSVNLKDSNERDRATKEIVEEVRKKVELIPGAKIEVNESSSMSGGVGAQGSPISVVIKGDNLETLEDLGLAFRDIIRNVPGTTEVKLDVEDGEPEARIIVDRNRASMYGVSVAEVANGLKASIEGVKATTLKTGEDEIDVVISLDEGTRSSIENMKQIEIFTASGKKVTVGQIADIEFDNSPTQIARANQVRTISVNSDITDRDLGSVVADIEKELEKYPLPDGYSYEFSGEQDLMAEAFSGLALALLLSLIIVYMILASQFESLLHPFTVMLSVPFALSGGFIGLFITGKALSLPAFIGIIMLAGIVVNNAIVLIDYINQLRAKGMERNDAIIKAGKDRFRPIMMTTLTTVLGLLPMAIGLGEGSNTIAPLAIVVVGGLSLSTVLTLSFIPVVYTVFDGGSRRFKNLKSKFGNRKNKKKLANEQA